MKLNAIFPWSLTHCRPPPKHPTKNPGYARDRLSEFIWTGQLQTAALANIFLIKCGRIVIRLQYICAQPFDFLALLSQTWVKEKVVFMSVFVCLSVSPYTHTHTHISETRRPNFTKFSVYDVTCGCASISILRRHCNRLLFPVLWTTSCL